MYDQIIARSPSIIYRPGGVTSGLVVTTWVQVQQFIATRQGNVIIYVDDSIVSPALVPSATGITDCQGRVELRPFIEDNILFSVLQIEPGATLQDLFAITGVELRCNAQNATPSLSFVNTPTGGFLNIQNAASLSNAATATQPGIIVPVARGFGILLKDLATIQLNAPAVPLIHLADPSSSFNLQAIGALNIPDNYADGSGGVSLLYDDVTAFNFTVPGTPPALPGLTGGYVTQNIDFSASGGALVGNVNGPSGANRFLALTQLGNDADVAVVDTEGWHWVRMTGLTANRNVTLPAAPTNGMVVVVKDGDGSLGAGFTITINGNGNTIDGTATVVMDNANPGSQGAFQLQFDSAAPNPGWFIF